MIMGRLAALLVLVGTAATAAAPTMSELFNAAIGDLETRFGPAEQHRIPPSERDSKVISDIAVITQARDQFGTSAFPVVFPDTFTSVCFPLQKLTQRYMTAGLRSDDMSGRNAAQAGANAHRYQASLVPIISFTFKCMALHMPEFQKLWLNFSETEKNSTRRNGVAQMRDGADNMVLGSAISTYEIGVTPANRAVMANTVADYTDELVVILPPIRRRQLLGKIDQTAPGFKRAWPQQYAKVRSALLDPTCTSICLVD